LAMFQPHRYSRTQALCAEFGRAFDEADRVVVTDVYAASETPIPGVSGELIAKAALAHGHRGVRYQPRLEWVHRDVVNMLEPGDLVLSLGAGNIHEQLAILAADLVIAEKLKQIVGEAGEVRLYEPLSKHTTLRVGGPAQFWVEPRDENSLGNLIRFCRNEKLPVFVMGRGSNLLVRDGGVRGVVIHPSGGEFDRIEVNGWETAAEAAERSGEWRIGGAGGESGGWDGRRAIPEKLGAVCA